MIDDRTHESESVNSPKRTSHGTAPDNRNAAETTTRKRTVVTGDNTERNHATMQPCLALEDQVLFTPLTCSPAATRLSKQQQLVEIDAIARVHVGAAEAAQNVFRRESLTRLSRHQLDERSEFSM